MERSPIAMLREFHNAFDLPRAEVPALPRPDVADLRQHLLEEEVAELAAAVQAGGLADIAHELADVIYVALGTAVTYGIDVDPILAEIHAANMTKLGPDGRPMRRADGKVLKGDNYRAPDVRTALRRQGWRDEASSGLDGRPAPADDGPRGCP